MEKRSWERDLPRAQYKEFRKVEQSQPWFEVYDIGNDIYAIYEPYQFQEVISYLIKGNDRALLWDTGNGIGDMKQCVSELWDKELIVVNSHCHFDHIGSNYQFDMVHVYDHPKMIETLEQGIPQEVMDREYGPETYSLSSPIPYRQNSFRKHRYRCFKAEEIFDLGGRQLKVIYTPGHSLDSIMLVDQANKILFTGDTYYPAPLYCFSENTFDKYVETMKMLAQQYSGYLLVTSHNEPLRDGKVLIEVANFFELIQCHKIEPKIDNGLEIYEWQGHSLMKK